MTIAMLANPVPPFGLGVYLRDRVEPVRWAFGAVNAWRADRASQAAALRAAGASVWVYGTPERFNPSTWREGVARLASVARELGAAGVIADPETGWPELARERRDTEARALGAALADLSGEFRVGATSYPSFPALDALAQGCRGRVFGSPQIYGRTSADAEAFASWLDAWRQPSRFGRYCIPSIAGWAAQPSMASAAGYRAYLAKLPKAAGAIVWETSGAMPAYIRDALNEYSPGGTPAGTAAAAAGILALHPPVVAVAALVVVVALVAARKG